jgi:hypothetical protein
MAPTVSTAESLPKGGWISQLRTVVPAVITNATPTAMKPVPPSTVAASMVEATVTPTSEIQGAHLSSRPIQLSIGALFFFLGAGLYPSALAVMSMILGGVVVFYSMLVSIAISNFGVFSYVMTSLGVLGGAYFGMRLLRRWDYLPGLPLAILGGLVLMFLSALMLGKLT